LTYRTFRSHYNHTRSFLLIYEKSVPAYPKTPNHQDVLMCHITCENCSSSSSGMQMKCKTERKLHCVSKKVSTFYLSVTLSNLNWFSKFLHCWKAYEICYKIPLTLCQIHTLQKPAPENWRRFLAPVFHASCKISGARNKHRHVLLVGWFTYVDVRSYLLAVIVKLFLFTRWQQCYCTSNTPIK